MILCDQCGSKDTKFNIKIVSLMIKGQKVMIEDEVLCCKKCGTTLLHDINPAFIKKAITAYKKNNKLLFADEIKQIRKNNNFTTREFSEKLGYKDDVVRSYELGKIQSKEDDEKIRQYKKDLTL